MALDLNPDFHPSHEKMGQVLVKLNELEEAETCYRHAIDAHPTAQNWTILGNILRLRGRTIDATSAFIQAVVRDRTYGDAYGHLGSVLEQDGRTSEAISVYERAIAQGVANDRIHLSLAALREGMSEEGAQPELRVQSSGTTGRGV